MRILFLSRWFPLPADNGSKLRIYNLLKILSTRHTVDLISFTSEPISEEHISRIQTICQVVYTTLYRSFNPRSSRSILGFLSPLPRFLIDTYSIDFEKNLKECLARNRYDLVIVSQIDMTPYIRILRDEKVVLDELELTVLFEARNDFVSGIKRLRPKLTWAKHGRYVTRILKRIDGCSAVSTQERNLILKLNARANVVVVPNGVDVDSYDQKYGAIEQDSLVYAGAITYSANFDAVNYFIRDILPVVKSLRPRVKLYVTGNYTKSLQSQLPFDNNVIFTGYLEDIRARIAKSWISIVPLRIGGGTRLKILESLALGTPVISTKKGAEGLDFSPGHDILIQDDPQEFARAIVDLLENPTLHLFLSENGKKAVSKNYDWKQIGNRFLNFVEDGLSWKD